MFINPLLQMQSCLVDVPSCAARRQKFIKTENPKKHRDRVFVSKIIFNDRRIGKNELKFNLGEKFKYILKRFLLKDFVDFFFYRILFSVAKLFMFLPIFYVIIVPYNILCTFSLIIFAYITQNQISNTVIYCSCI